MDYDVDILLAGSLQDVSGDALTHLGKLKSKHIRVDELPTRKTGRRKLPSLSAPRLRMRR